MLACQPLFSPGEWFCSYRMVQSINGVGNERRADVLFKHPSLIQKTINIYVLGVSVASLGQDQEKQVGSQKNRVQSLFCH